MRVEAWWGLSAGLLVLGFCWGGAARPQPLPAIEAPAPLDVMPDPVAAEGDCDHGRAELPAVIDEITRSLAALDISYREEPLSDCSGITHRVLGGIEARCPDAVVVPPVEEARSSRQLARWYADQSMLVALPSLAEVDAWLVPGAVVFYGRPHHRGLVVDEIQHVAVVTEVERDEAGRVARYTLFEGRKPGTVASFTHAHARGSSPPLGNGDEPLVALAFISDSLAEAAPALQPLPEEDAPEDGAG